MTTFIQQETKTYFTLTTPKGKKIGVELGFVSHLLLLNGLQKAGLSESDVELVNVPTHQTPQTLASGDVDAIVAWQPNSGQALTQAPQPMQRLLSITG